MTYSIVARDPETGQLGRSPEVWPAMAAAFVGATRRGAALLMPGDRGPQLRRSWKMAMRTRMMRMLAQNSPK
jgi:hypothetical protein